MASRKDLVRKFLMGIETGDAMAAAVVDESRYVQHNPQTREGGEGIAALFKRLSKTNPKVRIVRVFEDGDFAFAHNEYDFASVKVAFEVFRFEGDRAVEHWDNIQEIAGPNSSGRGMLDGPSEITDTHMTEDNRALVREFAEDVLIGRHFDRIETFLDRDGFIQHDPGIADGTASLRAALEASGPTGPMIRYETVHKVLAEGNFVLCMCEGTKSEAQTAFYDLYRVENGRIAEHWNTVEAIPPRSEWKNQNGKF